MPNICREISLVDAQSLHGLLVLQHVVGSTTGQGGISFRKPAIFWVVLSRGCQASLDPVELRPFQMVRITVWSPQSCVIERGCFDWALESRKMKENVVDDVDGASKLGLGWGACTMGYKRGCMWFCCWLCGLGYGIRGYWSLLFVGCCWSYGSLACCWVCFWGGESWCVGCRLPLLDPAVRSMRLSSVGNSTKCR